MKRMIITGSSGYLGSSLVRYFRESGVYVLGVDIDPPPYEAPDEFLQADINDDILLTRFQKFAPDTLIHAAFLLDPDARPELATEVNINGLQNILKCAAATQLQRLLVVSSATAYGAWKDNPLPIAEDYPLKAREGFRYAADKVKAEKIVSGFAGSHPAIATSTVRPSVIGSVNMDNYLKRVIFDMPFMVLMDGFDQPVQLVHETDVVGAINAVLQCNGRGAFNVAPDDTMLLSEIAAANGRWSIPVPFWLARFSHRFAGIFRLPVAETHREFLYFVRYPWVVSSGRLVKETGYKFQYTCRETMNEILSSYGSTDVNPAENKQ